MASDTIRTLRELRDFYRSKASAGCGYLDIEERIERRDAERFADAIAEALDALHSLDARHSFASLAHG